MDIPPNNFSKLMLSLLVAITLMGCSSSDEGKLDRNAKLAGYKNMSVDRKSVV